MEGKFREICGRNAHAISADLPIVSVIITNYNYSKYIEDCINSAINQTYANIEIIFVDDKSTDDSWDVVNKLLTSNAQLSSIKALQSPASVGQTGAAALGLSQCTGSFIVFLDADDVLLPRCIETHIYVHLSSRLAVGFSSVDCLVMNGNSVVARKCSQDNAKFITSRDGFLPGMFRPIDEVTEDIWPVAGDPPVTPGDVHYMLPPKCEPWVWSFMSGHCFRREAVELFLKGPLPGLKTGTDGFLVKPITALCGSIVIDRPLMGYRVHGENAFTLASPLINVGAYGRSQIERMIAVDKSSINQMLENIESFVQARVSADSFFQAVQQLCLSWPLNSEHGEVGYFRKSLLTHERRIVDAFGHSAFQNWLRVTEPEVKGAGAPTQRRSVLQRLRGSR